MSYSFYGDRGEGIDLSGKKEGPGAEEYNKIFVGEPGKSNLEIPFLPVLMINDTEEKETPQDKEKKQLRNKTLAKDVIYICLVCLIFGIILIFIGTFFSLSSNVVDVNPTDIIVVEDKAKIMGDTTELQNTLENFHNQTGIVPLIITVNDTTYKKNEDEFVWYAQTEYMNRVTGDNYLMFIYTLPKNHQRYEGAKKKWDFRCMYGDYVQRIVTEEKLEIFKNDLEKNLRDGEISDVLNEAFTSITPTQKYWTVGLDENQTKAFTVGLLFISFSILIMLTSGGYLISINKNSKTVKNKAITNPDKSRIAINHNSDLSTYTTSSSASSFIPNSSGLTSNSTSPELGKRNRRR